MSDPLDKMIDKLNAEITALHYAHDARLLAPSLLIAAANVYASLAAANFVSQAQITKIFEQGAAIAREPLATSPKIIHRGAESQAVN